MLKFKKKTETLKVICPWDPSIDTKKSDMKSYLETLDINHLKFEVGKDPSIIHITSMSRWVMAKLVRLNVNDLNTFNLAAFRHGIEKIENMQDHLLTDEVEIDGGTGVWIPEDVAEGPNGALIPCFSEEDAIQFFNTEFRNFVASVVAARSNLRKGKLNPYAQPLSLYLRTYASKE